MCAPEVLTGISMLSQAYAAQSANKQIAKQASVGAQNAVEEARFKYGLIETRERQEAIGRAQEITQRMREGMRERGQLMAQVADNAGESATLVQRLNIASSIQEAEDIGAVLTEGEFAAEQGQFERLGISLTTKARLEEAKALKETMIPPWMTALNMGVSGYQTWKAMSPPKQNKKSVLPSSGGKVNLAQAFGGGGSSGVASAQRISQSPTGNIYGGSGRQ